MSLSIEHVYGLTASSQAAFHCSGDTVVACSGSGAVKLDPISGDECSSFYSSAPRPSGRKRPAWDTGYEGTPPPGSPSRNGSTSPKSPSRAQPKANAASCVAISSLGFVAVGETGYTPRVSLYSEDDCRLLGYIREHQYGVNHLAFNPTGNLLLSLGDPIDGYIYVWLVDSKRRKFSQFATNKCISDVKAVAWLSDTQFLTVGVRHVRLWTIPDTESDGILVGRNVILKELVDKTFDSVCVLNGGRDWVVGTSSGEIHRLTPEVETCAIPGEAVKAMVQTPTGTVVVGTPGGTIEYDSQSWDIIRTYPTTCAGLVCTASGTVLSLDASGRSVRLLTEDSHSLLPHGAKINYIDDNRLMWWTPSGESGIVGEGDINNDIEVSAAASLKGSLVLGTADGDLMWLDGSERAGSVIRAHTGPVTDIAILGSSRIVTCGRDKRIQIWKDDGNLEQTLAVPTPVLHVVVVSPTSIACCTAGKTVHFFRSASEDSAFGQTKCPSLRALPLSLTTFKSQVIVSTADKQVVAFDATTGANTHTLRCVDSHGEPLTLSHIQVIEVQNQHFLVGSGGDKSLAIYSYPQGQLLCAEWGHSEPISGLAWCPATSTIATAADTIIERKFTADLKVPSPEASRASSPVRMRAPTPRTPPGSPPTRIIPNPVRPTTSPRRITHSPVRTASPSRPISPTRSRLESQRPALGERRISLSPVRPPRLVDPVAQLETALVEFNASTKSQDASKLKPLLVEALNKVDGLALVEEFSDKLLAAVVQKLSLGQDATTQNSSPAQATSVSSTTQDASE